jgi:hypothetical protein
MSLRPLRGAKPDAVVPTVTVDVATFDPLGVTEPGEKLQVTPGGGALQARDTAALNPPVGVTVTV